MGLDTTHECWHGPYSHFNQWRIAVQIAAGWTLDFMPYKSPGGRDLESAEARHLAWELFEEPNYQGFWTTDPADVLVVLIVHSDCDGVIPHRFCAPLSGVLRALAEKMCAPGDSWERLATIQFAEGLMLAHRRGEDVEFR